PLPAPDVERPGFQRPGRKSALLAPANNAKAEPADGVERHFRICRIRSLLLAGRMRVGRETLPPVLGETVQPRLSVVAVLAPEHDQAIVPRVIAQAHPVAQLRR